MKVSLDDLIKDMDLEIISEGRRGIDITVNDINRPGLQFAGFYNYFSNKRIQVIGKAEWSFLDTMHIGVREKRLKKFFQIDTPCTIIARGLEPHEEFMKYAIENNHWILRTNEITSLFVVKLMTYLAHKLAPETRIHGVLLDVYGIGIVIMGESGIGKSETALELIKRGHRLVSDDAVDIKAVEGTLVGTSPYITKGMLEVRGMGIIDVPVLYGLSSVLGKKNIHLIIYLEQWRAEKSYDRLGIDQEYMEILDIPIKKMTLPIRPGRNIAVIIETAAANFRHSINSKVTAVDTINMRMEEMNK